MDRSSFIRGAGVAGARGCRLDTGAPPLRRWQHTVRAMVITPWPNNFPTVLAGVGQQRLADRIHAASRWPADGQKVFLGWGTWCRPHTALDAVIDAPPK